MKPTVHDIAARAGVSLATVDRVLNGRPGVRAPTREKVEAAVAELGFVRDVAAANLAKSRVYTFAFIIPANDNSFMIGLRGELEAVRRWAAQDRISIQLIDVPAFDAEALMPFARSRWMALLSWRSIIPSCVRRLRDLPRADWPRLRSSPTS